MRYILAYDLGTSGVKASLYDEKGGLVTACYEKYETLYPRDNFREQRPSDWWQSIKLATRTIAESCKGAEIAAIGVSGHSLGCIAIDEKGALLTQTTPIWSDARAMKQADTFFEKVDYREWYETTGNGFPRHLYALFKQMWLKENEPELYQKTDCFLGSKDYINFLLTGVKCTDRSYASGSGAYSLKEERYVKAYLKAAGIDQDKMAPVVNSSAVIGRVTEHAAKELGITAGIAVVAGGVDNACMTLGSNCKKNGDAYASLGSSAWITICTDTPSVNFEAKTYTFAHCIPGMFIPSAGIFASGSALEWTIRNLFVGMEQHADIYGWLAEQASAAPAGADGLVFVPNLAGGSSFDPSPEVRGMLAGLDLKHTAADVVRAVYEGIALHLRCACDALVSSGVGIGEKLLLVGGGAKSDKWREIYASVFGTATVKTSVVQDAASLGAAALAAVGSGVWKDYSLLDNAHGEPVISHPVPEEMAFYQAFLPKYKKICAVTQNVAEIL